MSIKIHYDRCFWAAISCACLGYGLLLIPNYDDGNAYFFNLYNTVGLHHPFYNDLYGQYFHFMKPATLLYSLLLSVAGTINYRILALVQGAELLLCLRLFYLCALRYASKEAAQAGACVSLYLLAAQWAFTPLRPETTVLLCCLAIFWLCERFKETRGPAYLAGASALAFLVAIPMHTCGAIPCIYLLLFVVANWKKLSRKSLIALGALSCAFALAGAAILIYPGISSFAESLALLSLDGNRFSGLPGEYARVRDFVFKPIFFPLLLFIATIFLASLARAYKDIRLYSLKQYYPIALFLVAVVIGLGVLPSATWEVYMVYYYLPLIVGFSAAFDAYARRGGSLALLRLALVPAGALAFWWCTHSPRPLLYAALSAAGFYLAAAFARRMPAARMTVLVVAPVLLYQAMFMVSTKIIFERADQKIKEAGGLVLASARFSFSGDNVVSVDGNWCGAKTQILPGAGGTAVVDFHSVAQEKAAQIGKHRLVRLFGPAGHEQHKPAGISRRAIGPTFYGLSNDSCNTTVFLKSQDTPLRYTIVKKTPLSSEGLDTYASLVIRGLVFVEYSLSEPAP